MLKLAIMMLFFIMRTTITLDADVAAAVDNFRLQEGVGKSEAVNRLIRQAARKPNVHPMNEIADTDEAVFPRKPYVHRTVNSGLRVDVSNIGEVLELLDEADDR